MRPGARFGPAGDPRRLAAAAPLAPGHWRSTCSAALSVVDGGDLGDHPGQRRAHHRRRSPTQLEPAARAPAIVPIVLGGDHSIVLGELRAHAAVHGPLGAGAARRPRRHLGAATTASATSTARRFRRALEEGLIDPRAVAAGRHARQRCTRAARPRRAARAGLRDRSRATSCAAWRPRDYARARARAGRATGPRSCRSTST